jgi:hypothetical protein
MLQALFRETFLSSGLRFAAQRPTMDFHNQEVEKLETALPISLFQFTVRKVSLREREHLRVISIRTSNKCEKRCYIQQRENIVLGFDYN